MSDMKRTYPAPEIILYNGFFADRDTAAPIIAGAQALAIGRGRIMAIGSNDDILPLASADTEKIDLGGRLTVPGFIDTHIHFYEWSFKRRDLQLEGLGCLDNLLDMVRRKGEQLPSDQWIMGQGWNETDWSEPVMPSRTTLDKAAPNHPVLLWRCDLHLAVANSRALQLAGIDASTADPPEGRIERDGAGEPTGVLRELAINLLRKSVEPPGSAQVLDAFREGARALHKVGITGIHDVRLMEDSDGARALQGFQKLDEQGGLELRSWVTLPGHQLDNIIGLGLRSGFGGDKLRLGHVKFFSDGGMGARTAWMIDPFLDAGCGMPMLDMDELSRDIAKAEAAGLAVMVHAVGDRANRELIDIFEKLQANRGNGDRPVYPHRIEHVQMIRPEDARRLENLDLALCVTPCNMVLDFNLIDQAVGEKGKWTYAFRRLMDTGAPVMFSSDCPVCLPAPLPAIHAAVTRQRLDGTPAEGWHAGERVNVAEALNGFTAVPAMVHKADDLGVIAPGMKADLAVLSNNILAEPPEHIAETSVDMTIFEGRVVHRLF
ncbi:amidohydrolase [Desulfopila inferna]|nr:amidohydrolase [Desulfopila inferna]